MKQTIKIGEFTVTLEVISGALATTVEQAKSIEQPKEKRKHFRSREKDFYVGQNCKVVKWGHYHKGLDPDLKKAGFKIGDTVKIVGCNPSNNWPIIEGLDSDIDPDCLEPINEEQPKEQEYITWDYSPYLDCIGLPVGSRVNIVKDSEDEYGVVEFINPEGKRGYIHKSYLKPIQE